MPACRYIYTFFHTFRIVGRLLDHGGLPFPLFIYTLTVTFSGWRQESKKILVDLVLPHAV